MRSTPLLGIEHPIISASLLPTGGSLPRFTSMGGFALIWRRLRRL